MRRAAATWMMAAALVSCGTPDSPASKDDTRCGPDGPSASDERLRWIRELGDEDPARRESASASLLGMAEFLSDADCANLEAASKDDDVERAARARNLLRDIRLRRALGPWLLSDLRDFEAGRMEADGTARPLLEKAAGRWGGGGADDGQVEALVETVLHWGWPHGLDSRFMREHRVRPFARLFEDLPDPERVVLLGWSGNRKHVPEIKGLLGSEVPRIQQAAARALGQIGDATAAPELLRLLDSRVPDVREAALRSLAELRAEISDKKLETLLEDSEWPVRRAAAYAVARLRKTNAIESLARAWEREDSRGREEMFLFMAHLCDERLRPAYRQELLRNDAGTRLVAASAYIRTTRPVHSQDVAALMDSGVQSALETAREAAALLDPAEALPLLVPFLKDPRQEVREAAVDAVGELDIADAVEPLRLAMRDPDIEVRRSALWALGRRTRAWVDLGLEALNDPQLELSGLLVLGRHGAIEHADRIAERLTHADGAVRRAAIEALRDLDAREALPEVRLLVSDPVESVRGEAIFTVILWAVDEDMDLLRTQALSGNHRDRRLAAAELLFRGDCHELESLREYVARSGQFGLDYWDAGLSLLEPLFVQDCLRVLDDPSHPELKFFRLAWLSETAVLHWSEEQRAQLLERLRRLSNHPDEETRLSARLSRFYLEETPREVQLEILEQVRSYPERNEFVRELLFRSLAFAHAPEAFRDLGRPVRLEREVNGDSGFAAHLRERGYEVDRSTAAFVGRRRPGSWLTALASLQRWKKSPVIEGKRVRFLDYPAAMEYWRARLSE